MKRFRKAIAYNKKQGISSRQWRAIRETCGAQEKQNVLDALCKWQAGKWLEPDGMVGPRTRKLLLEHGCKLLPPVDVIPRGIWYDRKPRTSDAPLLKDLGFSMVNIMLNSSEDDGIKPKRKWRKKEVMPFVQACKDEGISVGVTVWNRPNRTYLDNLFSLLEQYPLEMLDRIEADAEGNWRKRHGNLEICAPYYIDGLRAKYPASKLGSTSYIYHGEYSGAGGYITNHSDYFCIQAYSTNKKNKEGVRGIKVPWNHKYGPGAKQRLAIDRIKGMDPKIPQHIGLPVWAQKWKGHTILEAMDKAEDEAVDYGFKGIWRWSAKHLLRKGSGTQKALRVMNEERST